MSVLCFGSYARLLKDATPLTNDGIIEALFGAFPSGTSRRDFLGSTLDTADKSRLINSKFNVPVYIKDYADTPAVTDSIVGYFQDAVIPKIKTAKLNALLSSLSRLINGDTAIPAADRARFLAIADEAHLAEFLSAVFLYAVQQPNNLTADPLTPAPADRVITIAGGKLYLNGVEVKLPDNLVPPENCEEHEEVYISELLLAYGDAEGGTVSRNAIPAKYQRNFTEQRQHYFNALAVHRRVRDVFPADKDEFEVLKNETYDGVIDLHSSDFAHGFARLLGVLAHVATINLETSLLHKELKWVTNSVRKGVCHVLVNDGRLHWVVSADE